MNRVSPNVSAANGMVLLRAGALSAQSRYGMVAAIPATAEPPKIPRRPPPAQVWSAARNADVCGEKSNYFQHADRYVGMMCPGLPVPAGLLLPAEHRFRCV